MTPPGFLKGRVVERQKHQNIGCNSEDWRGNSSEAVSGGISSLSNVFNIDTMMKRE
jgi:hypothetical protein